MRFRYFFLIARKILFKRKSTVLTASLAVAATIFLTIFTGVVFEGVTNTALIDFADFQYGDLLIRNEKTEEIDRPYQQVIDSVARYPLVEAAAPRIQTSILEINHKVSGKTSTIYKVLAVGVDPLYDHKVSKIFDSVEVGKPQLFKETALLGRDLADDLGFKNVNRPIEIKIKSGNDDFSKQLKVSGITSSSPFGGLNQILIVHIDLLRDLLNLEKGSSTSIIVKLKQPEKAVEVAYWIKQRYPDYEVLTTNEAAGWVEQAGTVTSFINLVGYAGMIASALAVITVLTMMVSGKTRDIGVFRSLGISKRGIILIFLIDGVLIGLIGGSIGTLLSVSAVLLLQSFPVALFGDIVLRIKFQLLSLMFPIILGFVISVLASLYPAWRASTYEPAEAVKYV